MIFFRPAQFGEGHSPAPQDATHEALQSVGTSKPHPVGRDGQDIPLCEFAREMAVGRASELADYFHAERQCFEALYARTGCFSHKGAADRAHINELKAREIHQSLIRSRGEK